MKSIFTLTVFLFFIVTLAGTAKAQTIIGKSLDVLAGNQITGAWRVNYAESDNPILKMQAFLQNKLALSATENNSSTKDDGLPTISVSLVPPETLTLAGGDGKSITINEGFSQVVLTRTFTADAKTRRGELQNGAVFLVTATQNDDFLKVEIVSPRGNKMSEIYTIADAGKKLIVTVRFETARAKEIFALRRVYDCAITDNQTEGAEQFQ